MKAMLKPAVNLTVATFAGLGLCFLLLGCASESEDKTDLQRSISSSSLTVIEEAAVELAPLSEGEQSFEEAQDPNTDEAQEGNQGRVSSNAGATQTQQAGSTERKISSNGDASSAAEKGQEAKAHEHSWVSKERVAAPAQSITKKCAKGNSHHTMWVVTSPKDGNKEHLYYRESDARAYANQLKAEGYSPICNSWYRPHYLSGTKSAVIETYEACSCGAERNHTRSGGVETWSDDGSPCQAWWGK